MSTPSDEETTDQEETTPAPTEPVHLLSGNTQWFQDPTQPGVWYVAYKMPNSNRYLVFEASAAQMSAIFGAGNMPQSAGRLTLQQIAQRDLWTYAGDVSEMQGEGSFEDEIARVTALAEDNGLFPEWLKDNPRAWDFFYIAVAENKSNEWLLQQFATLRAFKAHYQGLDTLMAEGLSLTEAIAAHDEFETGIRQLWASLGRDPASLTPNGIGALLDQGHSLTSVTDAVSVWNRMQHYAPALEAFNAVLVQKGMQPLTEAQMMQFLRGTAPQEMYQIYEASSFQEAAQVAGLGEFFNVRDAIRAALQTPGYTDLESVTQGMQTAANTLLRLRHELNMGKFGLTHEDLIDLSLGLNPRSGAREVDIRESVDRAMLEARSWLGTRSAPYRAYTGQGTPVAASLSGSRPGS